MSDDLAYATATELAARIRRRDLSPVEVIDAVITRIEARNPSLNALVFTAFDEAREQARRAEQMVTSGAALGPLHGVPTAIKDLFDFKPGWPATFGGIRALRSFSVPAYCTYAERTEAAGAVLVGKTNSPVMGFRGTCDNYLFGPSRNPFDTTKNTGGSSGGSAAAVADGLLPLAEGTDGGGSIRIPASWCGLYGYKASFGRVPYTGRPNAFGSINPFLFEGALTRTVDDAALALDVLAGYDDRDPFALDDPASFAGATRRSISGWRIAYSPDFGVYPVDRRVAAVVERAVRAFRRCRRRRRAGRSHVRPRPARTERPVVPADHPAQHRGPRGTQRAGLRLTRRTPRRLPPGVPALDRRGLPVECAGRAQRPADAHPRLRPDPAGAALP
jgi:amidase